MEERRIADYFVVAGLPTQESDRIEEDPVGTHLKQSYDLTPITDLAVIFPTLGETCPPEFTVLEHTPTGFSGDLNHGSLRSPEVFLCYRRGIDKPPLVDIGIMYEGKERILEDSEVLLTTPSGKPANVNNSTAKTFVTYRRAQLSMPCNSLVVTDICVIISSKGETPPHTFCIINKNLNKGMVGSDVYLCYKKSVNQAPSIKYKPVMLSRYPVNDRKHFHLPQSVPLFCLPMGATLEAWPVSAKEPSPVFSTFVLTVADAAEKVYGSAVTFYEQYSKDKLNDVVKSRMLKKCKNRGQQSDSSVSFYVVKSICLLSHWPFFDAFEKFLLFLYSLSRSGPHTIPIERHIIHFMENVPFPSPQRSRILVQLSATDRLILMQPEDLPLPKSGAGFHQLLMNLGPDNCLLLLLCALTEQKLLIHSLRPDVLTAVAEAVSMIIFPFKWQCPYIPLCPLNLAEVLHAPVPFLIGVDSRFFDLYDPPSDVNCVDLDTNNITLSEEKRQLSYKVLPKKPARLLRYNLEMLYHEFIRTMEKMNRSQNHMNIDRDFQQKRREQGLELRIQEAFLKFMVSILKGYRSYLLPIVKAPTIGATDTNSLFNLQMFLRSRDKSHHKFYSLLTKTQMFIRFIEERSFVSDLDAGLAFFDECIEKVEQEDSDTHLIELDESHQSERTVFISPPELNGLPHSASPVSTYSYQNGFTLNLNSFAHKGAIKNFLDTNYVNTVPGSPMARRSKYEVKCAQKLARKYFCSPELWAKCMLGTCYSLWFIHLPSFILVDEHKIAKTLRIAYELLVRIQKTGLQPTDEVCYRVMMQLCGVYSQPMLAVKLLILMKRGGIQPNAVTYGFYNRAVLESKWPSNMVNPSQLLWNKLRNVIYAAALFRQIGQQAGKRRLSVTEEACLVDGITDQLGQLDQMKHINVTYAASGGSLSDTGYKSSSEGLNENPENDDLLTNEERESDEIAIAMSSSNNNPINDEPVLLSDDIHDDTVGDYGNKGRRASTFTSRETATFDKFCSRMGNIVKSSGMPLRNAVISINQQSFESSAGLLMTGASNAMGGFTEHEPKSLHSEKANASLNSSPRIRINKRLSKRNRSGSCSEFTFSCSPRNNRKHYSYYSPQAVTVRTNSHDTAKTDCYHLLTRSESFANDAQILKNLQDMKQRSSSISNEPTRQKNYHPFAMNKSLFGRRGSGNLQKLKESSKNNSRASSVETLPSSGAGSMDDILSTCSNATKRLMTNKVLAAIGSKLNSSKLNSNETHVRKFSVTSLEDAKKQSTESLSRVSSSPSLKSPVRTPVTENDPLGALSVGNATTSSGRMTEGNDKLLKKVLPNLEVVAATSEIELDDQTGAPVLFDRRKKCASFYRSAGSGIDKGIADDGSINDGGKDSSKQRSSTMPADVRDNNTSATVGQSSPFKTGLGNLGSNFKLPFSPSSLASKKSNELIMGGLSSLKNAASSMAKKIDEFKEAMSQSATPLKDGSATDDDDIMDHATPTVNTTAYGEETPVKRKISNEFSPSSVTQQLDTWGANLMELFSDGSSRKGSSSNLQPLGENSPTSSQQALSLLSERLYPKTVRNPRNPVALELIMSTCSKCRHCGFPLYDEEIMSGWLPEDSNLNTKCSYCDKAVVPFLYITVLDYRNSSEMTQFTSEESMSSLDRIRRKSSTNKLHVCPNSVGGSRLSVDSSVAVDDDGKTKNIVTVGPIIVPYLNPLVLRKELESILNTEGDTCLTKPSFVDKHPIVYWNMVWVFERIAVTSHVLSLSLNSHCVLGNRDVTSFHPSWSDCDSNNVVIRTLWDNPELHEEVGYPMYVLWNKNDKPSDLLSALLTDNRTIPRSLMERAISCIQCNDLGEPLKRVAAERSKLKSYGINHNYSLYRDILFLSFVALGRENIDQSAFDKEYVFAYEQLLSTDKDSKLFWRCDNPNLNVILYFRHYFKELEV